MDLGLKGRTALVCGASSGLALASAEMAMRGIPAGRPDWLRAQDISMVAKAQIKKK